LIAAILTRHGESDYSARGLLNGDVAVPVGLTELGRRQALALGAALADERIDLCVTSAMQRARETADVALAGRDVPQLVLPDLNDPLYGPFEGRHLRDYRSWAAASPSGAVPGTGGESRLAIVERYVRGVRAVVARPEETVLAVAHSLPISYALGAREGKLPGAREPLAEYAHPYRFTADELAAAATLLEGWVAAPSW
jgi:broad specificity phosphatase PhoE